MQVIPNCSVHLIYYTTLNWEIGNVTRNFKYKSTKVYKFVFIR